MATDLRDDLAVLNQPTYEPAELARLVQLTAGRVRRWLFGYRYTFAGKTRTQEPVIQRGPEQAPRYGSFLDLIELLSVKAFLDRGFSLQRIRRACDEAADLLREDHPFARRRFFAGGRHIYLEIRHSGTANLLELLSGGQWAIEEVVKAYAEQIDFDRGTSLALRWWPLGKSAPVLVDPSKAFGAPVVARRGIKTANVFDLFMAESCNVRSVARWMQLEPREVEAAVKFERQQLGRAA